MNEQINAVQRMQDYIEEHLETDITLTELSEASLFSPWYSYRLFKNYLGLTPAEYIRRLRLSHSAMRLKKEQCLVIDAAYDCGFHSVDGYTRAFYREFGCNPGDYSKMNGMTVNRTFRWSPGENGDILNCGQSKSLAMKEKAKENENS